jgi:hypothetical protein
MDPQELYRFILFHWLVGCEIKGCQYTNLVCYYEGSKEPQAHGHTYG